MRLAGFGLAPIVRLALKTFSAQVAPPGALGAIAHPVPVTAHVAMASMVLDSALAFPIEVVAIGMDWIVNDAL